LGTEIYFIIAKGIALYAMPAFGVRHSAQEDLADGYLAAPDCQAYLP